MSLLFWACDVFFLFLFWGSVFLVGEVCGSAGVALVSFGFFFALLCCVALQKGVAEEAEKKE